MYLFALVRLVCLFVFARAVKDLAPVFFFFLFFFCECVCVVRAGNHEELSDVTLGPAPRSLWLCRHNCFQMSLLNSESWHPIPLELPHAPPPHTHHAFLHPTSLVVVHTEEMHSIMSAHWCRSIRATLCDFHLQPTVEIRALQPYIVCRGYTSNHLEVL